MRLSVFVVICTVCPFLYATQNVSGTPSEDVPRAGASFLENAVGSRKIPKAPLSIYQLGPGDQINVVAPELEDINGRTVRIDTEGDINLPIAGRLHATDQSVPELERQIEGRLLRYVKEPHVVINVLESRSQPISVLGAVGSPGIRQIEGRKTLYEIIAMAGGVRPDAGSNILITRQMQWGKIPLPDAKLDASGQYSTASVSVTSILNATAPERNILIKPDDVISVSKAEIVYAVGSVNKPGGFPLGQSENLSTLQVLSLAQGLQRTAAANKAKILRLVPHSSQRQEIAVDLKRLLAGKGLDVDLKADDILFVPNSNAKSISARSMDAIVTVATGLAVYGRF